MPRTSERLLKTDDALGTAAADHGAEDDAIFQALKEAIATASPRATSTRTCCRRERIRGMRAADPASVANLERLPKAPSVRLLEMNRVAGAHPIRLGAGWNRLLSAIALLALCRRCADAGRSGVAALAAGDPASRLCRADARRAAVPCRHHAGGGRVAFTLAMLIGSAIGIALGRSQTLDQVFNGWLVRAPTCRPVSPWCCATCGSADRGGGDPRRHHQQGADGRRDRARSTKRWTSLFEMTRCSTSSRRGC